MMAKKKKKKPRKLTTKLKLFCDYYMTNGWNGSKAAKQAKYNAKTDRAFRAIASENLTRLNVQEYISDKMSEAGMAADEVIARIASMARGFDIADYITLVATYGFDKAGKAFITGHDIVIDFIKLQDDGFSHLRLKAIALFFEHFQNGSLRLFHLDWHVDRLVIEKRSENPLVRRFRLR